MTKTQYYITYLMGNRGLLFEEDTESISHRDPTQVKMKKGAIGFRFSERTETEQNGETLHGPMKNNSGWYYKGKAYTPAEVEHAFPDNYILLSKMRNNNIKAVVFTDYGRSVELREGDVLLP